MGDLSPHFDSDEFACKCGCGLQAVQPRLIELLEDLRRHFGRPIHIVSGRRCLKHNTAVGGAKASKHLLGEAADIRIDGVKPREIYEAADRLLGRAGGVNAYATFCHVDVRPARWRG